jgi:hypothetical protein
LKYVLYGVLDGYPGFAATASACPARLPMPMASCGLPASAASPSWTARARIRPHPPQVKIETLVAQGNRYLDFAQPVTLASGTTSLRIEYTALSYTMPEALRFRYRLEGVDADWQDPGTRRAVSYTNLGPGDYRFRVRRPTSSASGTMRRRRSPYAYCRPSRRRWFYACVRWRRPACCTCCICCGCARPPCASPPAWRSGTHRARLHDSFLQSVHGLTMSFQSALSGLPEDSVARRKSSACC